MLGAVDLQAMVPSPEPSEMESSPFKTAPPFEQLTDEEQQNAWFTDGTARYHQGKRQWETVAFQHATETMLLQVGNNGSGQLAELQGVAAVIKQAPIGEKTFVYTDSWATYQGLVSWAPTWRKDGWKIKGTPIWGGKQLWEEMWEKGQKCQIYVGHVDAHCPSDTSPASLFSNTADQMAKTRTVIINEEAEAALANWAHATSGHLGENGTYAWAQQQQIPVTKEQVQQAVKECPTCNQIKQMPLQKKPSGHIRRGTAADTVWQLDYIGPLPKKGGKSYILTMVYTYSGLMLGMPCKSADQKSTL
ncbi:hypothetical protein NDU88_008823 [Pleurodeles waltl]|uniref:Uncharacterized protein n=1 Tax=Pleurodeles waltl TaxID=8319 RepID=A0AAV7NXP4_PLEWA|nr:hypothetical protein NDU88_008823 [Pleurodeles waltl]